LKGFHKTNKSFTFVAGPGPYVYPLFVAEVLPRQICNSHSVDDTMNEYSLEFEDPKANLLASLGLGEGNSVSIDDNNRRTDLGYAQPLNAVRQPHPLILLWPVRPLPPICPNHQTPSPNPLITIRLIHRSLSVHLIAAVAAVAGSIHINSTVPFLSLFSSFPFSSYHICIFSKNAVRMNSMHSVRKMFHRTEGWIKRARHLLRRVSVGRLRWVAGMAGIHRSLCVDPISRSPSTGPINAPKPSITAPHAIYGSGAHDAMLQVAHIYSRFFSRRSAQLMSVIMATDVAI
jgi:hypothetical protein